MGNEPNPHDESISATETINRRVLDAMADLVLAIGDLGEGERIQPATAIEMNKLGARLIEAACTQPDYTEFTEDLTMTSGEAFGQVLLKNLPHVIDGERMNARTKAFWITVAEELGPDWIEAVRVAAAFMKRVDGF
jgi:hypothetical protein